MEMPWMLMPRSAEATLQKLTAKTQSTPRLRIFFKLSCFSILSNVIPRKISSVHRDIHASWQTLCECERASQVKQPIGASEFIWNHCSRQDDRFTEFRFAQNFRGFRHSVRAVSDNDSIFFALAAMI